MDNDLGQWLHDHEMLLLSVAWDWFRHKNYAHNVDDIQDAVAEARYRLWKYRHTYAPPDGHPHPLETWVSLIVRQSCYFVAQQFRTTEHYDYLPSPEATPAMCHAAQPPQPDSVCIQRETISYQWGRLNPEQRRVIWLRYQGYDEHEIGRELGVTNIRIKSVLSSARRKVSRSDKKASTVNDE